MMILKVKFPKQIRIFTLTVTIFAFYSSYAQDCTPDSVVSWESVQIRIMEQKDPPPGFKVTGEWILKSKKNFTSVDDLTKRQRRKIKKHVAGFKSCNAFIDTKKLFASNQGLYYYWVEPES
jgi:hypothetical protein